MIPEEQLKAIEARANAAATWTQWRDGTIRDSEGYQVGADEVSAAGKDVDYLVKEVRRLRDALDTCRMAALGQDPESYREALDMIVDVARAALAQAKPKA